MWARPDGSGGGHAAKVLAEHTHRRAWPAGKPVPMIAPTPVKAPATPAPDAAPAVENVASLIHPTDRRAWPGSVKLLPMMVIGAVFLRKPVADVGHHRKRAA
jgi:hypothetical protein